MTEPRDDLERRLRSALAERATTVVITPGQAGDIARRARTRVRRRRAGVALAAAVLLPGAVGLAFRLQGDGNDVEVAASGTQEEPTVDGPPIELVRVDGPRAFADEQVGAAMVHGEDGFVTVALGLEEVEDPTGSGTNVSGTSMSILVSADGDTWERSAPVAELDDVYPAQLLERDGDYLLVGERFADDGSGDGEAVIAWSSGLTEWDVVRVPVPPSPDAPDWVTEFGSGTIAAWTDDGLVVAVNRYRMIDIEALTPTEYRDRPDVIVYADGDGLVVERTTDEPVTDGATVTTASAAPATEIDRIGWDELGIDPDEAQAVLEAPPTSSILRSEDGRTFTPVDLGTQEDLSVSALAGTDDGYVLITGDLSVGIAELWRSDDGIAWQEMPDTAGLLRSEGRFPGPVVLSVDDRLLAVGTRDDLPTAWVSDNGARTWRLIDLAARAGLNGAAAVELVGGGDSGVAVVLRSGDDAVFAAPDGEVAVEADGWTFTVTFTDGVPTAAELRAPDGSVTRTWTTEELDVVDDPPGIRTEDDGALTVLDPVTDAELVTFPAGAFERALEEAMGLDPADADGPRPQGSRLLVSTDLRTWPSADLGALQPADVMAWTRAAAVGDGRVLLGIDGTGIDETGGTGTDEVTVDVPATRWFGADLPQDG